MMCSLQEDHLLKHAKPVLMSALPSSKSWFLQIRDLCLKYCLPHPLQLIENPLEKVPFKNLVKKNITSFWENLLRQEASQLPSLHYFMYSNYSLKSPHVMWMYSGSSSYECSKSLVIAKMISGRYRTEVLCRNWAVDRSGCCQAFYKVARDLVH